MKLYILAFYFATIFFSAGAQTGFKTYSGIFLLHELENPIGKEIYYITKKVNGQLCTIDFKLTDRHAPVELHAQLRLSAKYEPVNLTINGKTSNVKSVNDTITIRENLAQIKVGDSAFTNKITGLAFPILGYAPGTLQQELLRYWTEHHRPDSINILPFGSVQIINDGFDNFKVNNTRVVLERIKVNNLVWGNEFLWINQEGKLIGLVTNDVLYLPR